MEDAVIVTHSGTFHADDVFAVACLLIFLEGKPVVARLVRSRDPKIIETGDFVVDVGNVYDVAANRFDHHQKGGAGERAEGGIPYASFGLVWDKFGSQLCGSTEIAKKVDRVLVSFIDAFDNGVGRIFPVEGATFPFTISDMVSVFNLTYQENGNQDGAFLEAVEIARRIMARVINSARVAEESAALVRKAYEEASDKRIVVLDNNYLWREVLSRFPEPLYVVEPDSTPGQWEVNAVGSDPNNFAVRKDMPASWSGKRGKELAEITGVGDALFCHNKLFCAVAGSKEGAIALARLAADA
ncbi:MAG: hypothetical protein A3H68_02360 [Candidatus Taylorbacteria bacterium RIFCSPLOWO2_02_FULL_46_40]|uniref:Metal-dependent hydrolase n=1 Tax=Candidatus Taylorbacteria bacterium RIFCSPLOWO2_02_FULL_46_40 TaxID=1802329 RepID=A0A1G2P1G4_9BACT|nr:MAG: hypothetical protein A3H68_02360 [Candidatus Taylorbacteria bacterium RIFCSPLOWO2_02_FULL_46_40]